MSTQSPAVQKLSTTIRDLVSKVPTPDSSEPEVAEWIDQVASGALTEDISGLNAKLIPRTYAVGQTLTTADVAIYAALHPIIAKQTPKEYYSYPAVTRYFDHIQSQPSVRTAAEALAPNFQLVQIDLENAPAQERLPDAPKVKKAKAVVSEAANSVAATAAPVVEAVKNAAAGTSTKKEKKEKAKPAEGADKKKPEAKAAAEDAGPPVPSMIDLRVGKIVDIKKHPDADSLYVEQIDIGEETGPRTVVSGLVNYIPIEEMRDRYLIAVCNLKPANMRGVKSHAMVLCASLEVDGVKKIELMQPPAGSKPGDRVYFEGPNYESATPLSQLNPKKKIFETVQPGFTTLDTKEGAWVDPATKSVHRIRTSNGFVLAPSLVGASLS